MLADLISKALSTRDDQRLHRRGRRRALVRRVDQRYRALRSRRSVVEDRQGPAGVEPAGAAQAPARGRSADDRPSAVSAASASRRKPAAGNDVAPVDPARIAGQGDRQAVRHQGALARRAGHRRRRAARHRRQGEAGAAVRRPRSQTNVATARRAGRVPRSPLLCARDRQADARRELRRTRGRPLRPSRQSSQACRPRSSPSTARDRSTISRRSSTSPPARTSGRGAASSSRGRGPAGSSPST